MMPEKADIATASIPLPSRHISCAGYAETAKLTSGIPRKVAGIASAKVWAMEAEIIKIMRSLLICLPATRRAIAVLTWIPGVMPVKIPSSTPRVAVKISMFALIFCYLKSFA